MDKIPIYNIVVDLNDDTEYMSAISFVEFPAVEYQFLTFDKEKPQLKFSVDDELEHKVTSVVCLCDVPIYRYSPDMGEFYVKFDKTAIDNMIYKYSKLGLNNMVNLQHNENNFVDGVTMVEMYQVNRANGIVHKNFPDVPDYSLMATFKIENRAVWDDIISGKCNGYSLELYSSLEPTNESIELSKQEPEEEDINSFIDELYNYLIGEGIDNNDIEMLFADSKKKIIENSIKEKKPINIILKGSSKIHNGFVYSIFDVDGSNNIALYNYTKKEWELINLSNIEKVNINSKSNVLINWQIAQEQKGFSWIQNIIENATNVKETALQPTNFYEDIIMNKKIVMLKYSDGDGRCETYRQCLVCEYGTTRAGNRAIRAYEYSGTSHNVLDGTGEIPDWRCFLISRITDIKLAPEGLFKPITQAPPKFNPDPIKDRDDFIVIYKSVFD